MKFKSESSYHQHRQMSGNDSGTLGCNGTHMQSQNLGYPPGIFLYLDSIHCNIFCGKCNLILRKPVQTSCGHHFCKSCLYDSLEKTEETPVKIVLCQLCKKEGTETVIDSDAIYEDRNIAKLLNSLNVACTNHACPWRGRLEQFDEHLRLCPEVHSVKDAAARDVEHVKRETKMFVDVPSKDSESRDAILNTVGHMSKDLTSMRKLVSQTRDKLTIVDEKTNTFGAVSGVFHSTADAVLTHCAQIQTLFQDQVGENQNLKKTVEALKRETALLQQKLDGHVEETAASLTGSYVWKIENFEEKRRLSVGGAITHWLSPPFQTSQFGYRMQLKIYPNGDGNGKGKYVSLFFVLLKSTYDDILKWPFQQKVKLFALDQSGRGEHVVDAFRPDLSSSSFQKPVGPSNVATGCPLFLPSALLANDGTREGGVYVKNDVMYVKVIVDKTGLDEV